MAHLTAAQRDRISSVPPRSVNVGKKCTVCNQSQAVLRTMCRKCYKLRDQLRDGILGTEADAPPAEEEAPPAEEEKPPE